MTRLHWLLAVLLLAPLSGCPSADDDDSAAADDDDSASDDDDAVDDDDAADDDDDDDDDDGAGQDYDSATIPDFGDCDASQNQFKIMLGDGTEIGPFSGFSPAPTSFANNSGNWTLRMGSASTFNQLQGNRTGYATGSAITMQGPPGDAGNVVSNVLIGAGDIGASPGVLGGGYGLPLANADGRVGGEVTFSVLPEPDATATGTFSAVLQHQQQLTAGNVVLLGIRGCFEAALTATD